MSSLVWLHEDVLRLTHPVFNDEVSYSCFIWDEQYFQSMDYSFKRLVFLYETLCEMGVKVIKGDTIPAINQFIEKHDIDVIRVAKTNNPLLKQFIKELSINHNLETVDEESFVSIPEGKDYKRFFKFWNDVKKSAFKTNK